MDDLVPGADPDEAVARYREHHPAVMLSAHAADARRRRDASRNWHAAGCKLAVCSNKRVEFTRRLVDGARAWASYFAAVLGPDDVGGRAKPDPAMLLEGLSRLGVSPAEAVYVGDMAIDVQTAQARGRAGVAGPGGRRGRNRRRRPGRTAC